MGDGNGGVKRDSAYVRPKNSLRFHLSSSTLIGVFGLEIGRPAQTGFCRIRLARPIVGQAACLPYVSVRISVVEGKLAACPT